MTHRNEGGPAFPVNEYYPFSEGMSLRDWFAGQALVGYLAGNPDADCGPDGYAHDAYQVADAMLKARMK